VKIYTERISFDDAVPIAVNVCHIDEYPLHCHEDAIEIIFVLQGSVQVKISFEHFTLSEGDFVIVNREDSHKICRQDADDNMVAIFHVSLQSYRATFPHIDYVIFACESFDLAKYKGQTAKLRRLLLKLLDSLSQGGDKAGQTAANMADSLMQVLVGEYSLERYYNRSQDISADKLAIYYSIIQHIYENYPDKNLLQDISRRKFYSESYISHLFKEVGAASFQDILGYIRVFRAERLLLETDCPVATISKQCGFSDSKYFNQTFQKWFQRKPSMYRKIYQLEVGRDIRAATADAGKVADKIRHLENLADDATEYKISITPITLKNIGSKNDLLNCLNQDNASEEHGDYTGQGEHGSTYAIIRIGEGGNPEHTRELLENMLHDLKSKTAVDLAYWFIK
jgi:AraC-like DNA-binding protein